MSLHAYYLRAADRASMEAALRSAGILAPEGGSTLEGAAIDHVGAIPGATGWHTNVLLRSPLTQGQAEALPVIDPPDSPSRTFFADIEE